ncbi:MAG TPA: hypothetical protein VGI47_07830 [Candidatus Binataceae bacterium]|jgi:hypothetical protein
MSLLETGDRIVVIDRKLFRDDNTRLFIGVVEHYENGIARVSGFGYHISPYEVAGTERRAEERTRLIPVSWWDVVYVLPKEIEIGELQLRRSPKSLVLTDGKSLMMDLSDWLYRG